MKYTLILPALALLAPAVVSAQEPAKDDVVSVFARNRPDYDANTIHAGAFTVTPAATVQGVYDDNIFATSSGKQSDIITIVSPSVGLQSGWRTHSVGARVGARSGFYNDFSDENYNDYYASLSGRADVTRGQAISTNIGYSREHESRSSPDDVNGIEPTEYDNTQASIDFTRAVSRVSMQLGGDARRIDYKHVGTGGGGVITNAERDRDEYGTAMKVGYEYIPHYTAYVRTTYDWVKYDITSGLNRNSQGYGVVLGTDVNLTGTMKGDVYAGYLTREYEDPALDSVGNLDFGGSLLWNATQLTSLKASASRTIEETIQPGASGYVNSKVALGVEHELRRNILLGVNGDYTNQLFDGGPLERTDHVYGGGTEVTYLLPYRGVGVGLGYRYEERVSDITVDEYQDNRVMLTLKGAL